MTSYSLFRRKENSIRLKLFAISVLWAAAAAAAAAPITYSGSGTFVAGTNSTAISAPNGTFSFSFVVDSNPVVSSFNSSFFDPAFSSVSYVLNGSAVSGSWFLTFYTSSASGMFELCRVGSPCLQFAGPQMFSGVTSAPTMLTGSFTSTFFSAGAQQSNITVTGVSGEVPEPMTVSLMGAGLLGLGLLRRRTAK